MVCPGLTPRPHNTYSATWTFLRLRLIAYYYWGIVCMIVMNGRIDFCVLIFANAQIAARSLGFAVWVSLSALMPIDNQHLSYLCICSKMLHIARIEH